MSQPPDMFIKIRFQDRSPKALNPSHSGYLRPEWLFRYMSHSRPSSSFARFRRLFTNAVAAVCFVCLCQEGAHIYTHTQKHTHTHKYAHAPTRTNTCTHIHPYAHAHTHIHRDTQVHTNTEAHIHTPHIHIHRHRHTYANNRSPFRNTHKTFCIRAMPYNFGPS
jgi:hypothetical protein